jgi:hypothetical protein
MEIKRPDQITEADIPNIESPFFASSRVRRVFEGFGGQQLLGIKGLDVIVEEYMPRFLGRDLRTLSAYWEYYKSGERERNRDYDFRKHNPVKDQVLKDFEWGKYLIVLQSEYELFRFAPLFQVDASPSVKSHDRWKQSGGASPSSDYMGFEGILNRAYPKRKRLDYHPFYGPGSSKGEVAAEEITLSPEPWPPEKSTVLQSSLAAAAAQPAPQPAPTSKPAPKTTIPRRPPANDPVFNAKKGIRLTRVLGGIAGVILGVFIPDNASLEEEWEVDGVNYKYNTDDFSLEITNPDGSKEQVIMYPDGTVTDQQGAILGSADKDGGFTPATEQEEVDFRVWKANGGEGSFAVWKNSGKPNNPEFEGRYKGKPVTLRDVEIREITYERRSRESLDKLRKEFDSTKRKNFLKLIANDPEKIAIMKKAGLTDAQIAKVAGGNVPKGYNVHHKIPLDDGGTNDFDNLVLIKNSPEHYTITNAQRDLTSHIPYGESVDIKFPIPPSFLYPL